MKNKKRLWIVLITVLFVLKSNSSKSATFYVSDKKLHPSSNNLGTYQNPWTEIPKVIQFLNRNSNGPRGGDSILFERGASWNGRFMFNFTKVVGKTSLTNPLLISDYGSSNLNKPQFNGNGTNDFALQLLNASHVVFENMAITNLGSNIFAGRTGLESRVNGTAGKNIYGSIIRNCEIFDVNGHWDKLEGNGGGSAILIKATGGARFVNAIIEHNYIHDVSRSGIWGNYNAGKPGTDTSHLHENFKIRYNLIERIPGDAIVAWGMQNSTVEYNIAKDFTACPSFIQGNAAAGIWAFHCENVTIQHNQVSDHVAFQDGQGYDADFNCINTIIQHNYSFNNSGGFLLICVDGGQASTFNSNPIIRYNLSLNDGYRRTKGEYQNKVPTFHISGPVSGAKIYNNTIYCKSKSASVEKLFLDTGNWGGGANNWPTNTVFQNNTFYGEDSMGFHLGNSNSYIFDTNHYYNTTNSYDENGIELIRENENWWKILLTNSANIAGLSIPSNSSNQEGDFFGNEISSTSLGAFAGTNVNAINIEQPIADHTITVNFPAATNAQVRIENLLQTIMEEQTYASLEGDVSFSISDYPAGVYFIYLEEGNNIIRRKFIKVEESLETVTNGPTSLVSGANWSTGNWTNKTPKSGYEATIEIENSIVDDNYSLSKISNTPNAQDMLIDGFYTLSIDPNGSIQNNSQKTSTLKFNCNINILGVSFGKENDLPNNYMINGSMSGTGNMYIQDNSEVNFDNNSDLSNYNGNYFIYNNSHLIFNNNGSINANTNKRIQIQDNGSARVTFNKENICNYTDFQCNNGNFRTLNLIFNANQDNLGKFILKTSTTNTNTNRINVTLGSNVTLLQLEDHSNDSWTINQTLHIIGFKEKVLNFGKDGLSPSQLSKISHDGSANASLALDDEGYLVYSSSLSTESIEPLTFTIYPSPISKDEEINVIFKDKIKKGNIQIYNTTGLRVYNENFQNKNNLKISTAGVQCGIYFVKINSENNSSMTKILVQ